MAIQRISGKMLQDNLLRGGVDIAIETDLLFFDVSTGRIGINNATPSVALDVTGEIQVSGAATFNNITIDANAIVAATTMLVSTSGNGILTLSTGTGAIDLDSTSSMIIPVGTTAQRPSVPAAGHMRFNTDINDGEVYDGTTWNSIQKSFTVTSQQIVPDGLSFVFTLDNAATTDNILVSVNGIIQDPNLGAVYSVFGTTITFTSTLLATDIISIRYLSP